MPREPKLVEGTIDSISVKVPKETTILHAAKSLGIEIPTLCHHEGLPPDGNCRLCLSEIGGKLAVSCMFPIRDEGFNILTKSPRVLEARRFVLSLLINRAPKAPRIIALAKEYGAEHNPRFAENPDNCIRCGRCARSCRINKTEAIALAGRGAGRLVSGPFHKPPKDCVGCLACALGCPTGNIPFRDFHGVRSIWGREFELVPCPSCGAAAFTREQLDFLGAGPETASLCPECRKRRMARSLRDAGTFLVKDVFNFELGR